MSNVSDVYSNPQLARFLDSMEGVPDWPQPAESPVEAARRGAVRTQIHQVFGWLGTLSPGIALAAVLAFAGLRGSSWVGTTVLKFSHSPISAILVALLLGLLIRNAIGLPAVYESGLRFCLRHILRFGIMLLGLRLSLTAIGQIGLVALPIIICCITTALLLVTWIGKALGLPKRLGSLIAVGTSICGVSAIVATGPVIEAEEDEVSYAVACVTIFGMVALFSYPFLAALLFEHDPKLVGLFLGTAIHDTAQVTGAGLIYQQQFNAPTALDTAAVVKLVRNVFMAGVIPLMAILYHRSTQSARTARPKWHQVMPLFVLGFVAMAALRSLGDLGRYPFGILDKSTWTHALGDADALSSWCLTIAMASVGLGTGLAKLRGLGLKPFCVGLAAAVVVGAVSFGLIKLLAPWI